MSSRIQARDDAGAAFRSGGFETAGSRCQRPEAGGGKRRSRRGAPHLFGAAAERPLISQLIQSVGAEVNIIAGTIDEIGGKPMARSSSPMARCRNLGQGGALLRRKRTGHGGARLCRLIFWLRIGSATLDTMYMGRSPASWGADRAADRHLSGDQRKGELFPAPNLNRGWDLW